jgi:predicted aspartyl protease
VATGTPLIKSDVQAQVGTDATVCQIIKSVEPQFIVMVTVDGFRARALLDTGATMSFLAEKFAKNNKLQNIKTATDPLRGRFSNHRRGIVRSS